MKSLCSNFPFLFSNDKFEMKSFEDISEELNKIVQLNVGC